LESGAVKLIDDIRGFTLTEVTIAMAILSVAITGAAATFITLSRLHQKTIAIQEIQQESRFVVESIERDIANSSNVYTREMTLGVPDDGDPSNDMLVIESGIIDRQEIRYTIETDAGRRRPYRQLCTTVTNGAGLCTGQAKAPMTSSDIFLVSGQFTKYTSAQTGTGAGLVALSMTFEKNSNLTREDPYFSAYQVNSAVSVMD